MDLNKTTVRLTAVSVATSQISFWVFEGKKESKPGNMPFYENKPVYCLLTTFSFSVKPKN